MLIAETRFCCVARQISATIAQVYNAIADLTPDNLSVQHAVSLSIESAKINRLANDDDREH